MNMKVEGHQGHDMAALQALQQRMEVIRNEYPAWYAHYEDSDPITADRETLVELSKTAPNEFSQGLIVGITIFRQQLAILTGREF